MTCKNKNKNTLQNKIRLWVHCYGSGMAHHPLSAGLLQSPVSVLHAFQLVPVASVTLRSLNVSYLIYLSFYVVLFCTDRGMAW